VVETTLLAFECESLDTPNGIVQIPCTSGIELTVKTFVYFSIWAGFYARAKPFMPSSYLPTEIISHRVVKGLLLLGVALLLSS